MRSDWSASSTHSAGRTPTSSVSRGAAGWRSAWLRRTLSGSIAWSWWRPWIQAACSGSGQPGSGWGSAFPSSRASPWHARSGLPRGQREFGRASLARVYVEPLRLPGTGAFLDRFVAEHATSSQLDLGRIRAPTLVIGPLEDRVVLPEVTRSVAARIPGSRYVAVPGAGHSVAAEAPDLVADLIAEFLGADR